MAPARSFTSAGALAALACAALAALAALAGVADAQQRQQQRASGWQICNETSYVIEAAAGRPDGRAIVVQGWWRLRPGECRITVGAPLARGTHYLYARSSGAHRGGRRQWGGDARLCIDPSGQFTIENPPNCATMGLEERRFRRVAINKRDTWRTSLAETQPYTLRRARQAGLQRLLEDAGFDLRQGRRGADPRRIAQAIAQFRSTANLAPNASENQLIDALEAAARRRSQQVGLTLCNRTNSRLWTAIARRRGEGWESRGWWSLNPGGCVRTIDENLMQELYYVHAAMETSEGPRLLAAGGEAFCTSGARFAILGRENCEARYYDEQLFTPIGTRGRPGLIVDFRDEQFLPPGETPRQLRVMQENAARAPQPGAEGRRGLDPETAPTQDRPSAP